MKGRKTLLLLLFLSLVCAASSCGFKDIDKRFFVVAMGIDRGSKSDTFRVTLRLAIPSSKIESGETKTEVESFEAPSIAEAVRHLKALVDKELDFGHCRVILFGKPLMEDGVSSPLKWLSRRRDIAMVSFMGMAEPDAFQVLKLHPQSERYPGNALFLTFGSEGTESSFTLTEYLFDWARRQRKPVKTAICPSFAGTRTTTLIVSIASLFWTNKSCASVWIRARRSYSTYRPCISTNRSSPFPIREPVSCLPSRR